MSGRTGPPSGPPRAAKVARIIPAYNRRVADFEKLGAFYLGRGYDAAEDRRRHTVSEGGVVVVTPGEECRVDQQFREGVDV